MAHPCGFKSGAGLNEIEQGEGGQIKQLWIAKGQSREFPSNVARKLVMEGCAEFTDEND
jgi:hypothetical protein